MSGNFRVGTSGYQYDHWRGRFYPEDLPKRQWFAHYATHFDTVEINNTFYHLPARETFAEWAERAPEGFLYILKFSRYGSHLKCLQDPEDTIGNFLENSTPLGHRRGPILVQLRPGWHVNVERLDKFLATAPDSERWAVEFRDATWLCEEVYDCLRRHAAALVIHDMIQDHPRVVTADWIYLRFHGDHYAGSYSHQALTASAQRIRDWLADGLDVYAFFNNDEDGYAVDNARDLRRYVES